MCCTLSGMSTLKPSTAVPHPLLSESSRVHFRHLIMRNRSNEINTFAKVASCAGQLHHASRMYCVHLCCWRFVLASVRTLLVSMVSLALYTHGALLLSSRAFLDRSLQIVIGRIGKPSASYLQVMGVPLPCVQMCEVRAHPRSCCMRLKQH